jgi:uncharacterized protein YuzE
MASQDDTLNLDYDEQNDVLYASLGSPQAALSYEISKDVWLDYIPPNRTVVGITVLNFLEHYPVTNRDVLLEIAQTVVQDLLRRSPSVPIDQGLVTIRMSLTPSLQIIGTTTATAGTYPIPRTHVVGFVSRFETLRIEGNRQGNRVVAEDTVV